tara:strand:- start:2925 stop:4493 length:1569 start_codon:yes stop_codon:yes gene_type:complete
MSAIITDQLRILNAENFVAAATSSANSYYSFVGLPNAPDYSSTWDSNPPAPKDSFDQENDYWDTMIALKKITSSDVRRVVNKNSWTSGVTYDMYRNDISRTNTAKPSGATNLYSSKYFVVNEDFKVYICLQNGTDPENLTGRPSLDQPTFTDLEPKSPGDSGDGYIWKYLYTIKPSDIVKFDSTNFMPVPDSWETDTENAAVRNNASSSGQLKVITIVNRGSGIGTANRTYTGVPINGDGSGAEATIVINNDAKVESVNISKGGSNYTFGTVDLEAGGVPTGTIAPIFNVIIPPQGGHGANIYRELGAHNVLIFSKIENDSENPDFITGNQIARIGIVENPLAYNSSNNLALPKASALYALKLIGSGSTTATFNIDGQVTQTVGVGSTAVGRVVSYDQVTGVLKYWQDKSLVGFNSDGSLKTDPKYGFTLHRFTSTPTSGGSLSIASNEGTLGIDTSFGTSGSPGISTVINNRKYFLGQSFTQGISNPEVEKYSGNIIYVDNRPSITRSANQREDIKVILQF